MVISIWEIGRMVKLME